MLCFTPYAGKRWSDKVSIVMCATIAVGARNVGAPGETGVSTYASNLCDAIQRNGDYVGIAGGGDIIKKPYALSNKLRRFFLSLKKLQVLSYQEQEAIWSNEDFYRKIQVHFSTFGRIATTCASFAPDLVHWTYPYPVCWNGVPNIVTVHDLVPILRPDLTGINSGRMEKLLEQCLGQATAIATISDAVRRDIENVFPQFRDKVVVLGQSVSLPVVDRIAPGLNKPDSPFLYFGSIEKRKNIRRLILAHGRSGTNRTLILVGNHGFGAEAEMAAINDHPRPHLVRHIQWCERQKLLDLIAGACAVLFPSLAEGFGLPILEGMMIGTPVLTSRLHAMEEVAGNAALLVDPYNVDELAEAIRNLDRNLELRNFLAISGLNRAKYFSMDRYALNIKNMYGGIST